MAATITETLKTLRQQISRQLDDYETGTVVSANTTNNSTGYNVVVTGRTERFTANPPHLRGAEVSFVSGTVESTIIENVRTNSTNGQRVFSLNFLGTDRNTTSEIEIHNIGGRGFTKAQYDQAINNAIDVLADGTFAPTTYTSYGAASVDSPFDSQGTPSFEYPLPSSVDFNYVHQVDFLGVSPAISVGFGNHKTTRNLGYDSNTQYVSQSFTVQQTGWFQYISVPIKKVGTPAYGVTLTIESNSSGDPAAITGGVGSSNTVAVADIDSERFRYIVFKLSSAVRLTASTLYHIVLKMSTASNSTSNYYQVSEDTSKGYADGDIASGSTVPAWTRTTTSNMAFVLFTASDRWLVMNKSNWEIVRGSSNYLRIPRLPYEGAPFRIHGLAPLAHVTAESDVVNVRPDYVRAHAILELLSSRVGQVRTDNYAEGARAWAQMIQLRPNPRTPLPKNSRKVF